MFKHQVFIQIILLLFETDKLEIEAKQNGTYMLIFGHSRKCRIVIIIIPENDRIKMVKVSYDPEVDALFIYKEKERAAFSIEVLKDFVMDVDSSRKVIALEILNASKVLNIPKSELKNVQKGMFPLLF